MHSAMLQGWERGKLAQPTMRMCTDRLCTELRRLCVRPAVQAVRSLMPSAPRLGTRAPVLTA